MSLSGALSNAFSGLQANARAAALVSTNIANATTEGYGQRSLALSPGTSGSHGGVRIDAVVRQSDPVLLADRRLSDAALGQGSTMLRFAERLESLIGETGGAGSLANRLVAFENALTVAAANPSSDARLETVAGTADALARSLNTLSGSVQAAREEADRSIASDVARLNATLKRLDRLNDDFSKANGRGQDLSSLQDERQRLIDGISGIVPLRVVARERGQIAVFTMDGAPLLDGRPATIGFAPTALVAPGMTVEDGLLAGLTLDGRPMASGPVGLFRGGTLAAAFRIRDETATEFQASLDGLARDLAERLGPGGGGPDTTLGTADAGLFADAGALFDAADETGFAGRIALNALVAPGSGGAWRLRDGLGAAAPDEAGDGRLLERMEAALSRLSVPGSASLGSGARGLSGHVSAVVSGVTATRVLAETEQTFLAAQSLAQKEAELSRGVDTDAELQRLLQIEKLYAANAQVLSAVDEMMQRLLNI